MTQEPLHKRYGHIADDENSEAEERYARQKFSLVSQEMATTPATDKAESVGLASAPLPGQKQSMHVVRITGFVKLIVFDVLFGVESIESMPAPDQIADGPELYRDKLLFAQCKQESKQFMDFLGKHKESLKSRMRSKFASKSPMLFFHSELFKWRELHRVNKKEPGKGAFNIWNNELIRAGSACTQLVVHPLDKDPHKGDSVPEPFGAYFTREQADVLIMCHAVYHFLGYMTTAVCAVIPEGDALEGKSFYDTWLYLTGGNDESIDKWPGTDVTAASPFVKAVVHLRDTLNATVSWLE